MLKTVALLLLFVIAVASASFCPSKCTCTHTPIPTVDCQGAGLSYIPHSLNPRLRSLNLRGNKLTQVSQDELSFFQELEFLDLSENSILEIQPSAFLDLSKLQVLKLHSNLLATLQVDQFVALRNLRVLDLSRNGISRVPTSVFVDLVRLETLNLSDNVILELSPAAFTGLHSLKELTLKNNALMRLPAKALRPLLQLRSLDLGENGLSFLPAHAFGRQALLTSLNLARNAIETVSSHAFKGLNALRHLNLDFNNLTTIPTLSFSSTPALDSLTLKGNRFSTIPTSAFDGLSQLTSLTLSHCSTLKTVQMNAFSGLFNLKTLILAENPSFSEINQFAFETDSHLEHLHMHGNNLTSITEGTFSLTNLQTLDLRYNPWTCDCQISWLNSYLRASASHLSHGSIVCAQPLNMMGKSLLDDNFHDVSCPYDNTDRQIIMTVILVGGVLFCLTIIVVLLYSLRRNLTGIARKYGLLPPVSSQTTTDYSTYMDPKYILTTASTKSAYSGTKSGVVSNCYYYTDEFWLGAEEHKSFTSNSSGYYSNISLKKSSPRSKDATLYKVVSNFPVPITEL